MCQLSLQYAVWLFMLLLNLSECKPNIGTSVILCCVARIVQEGGKYKYTYMLHAPCIASSLGARPFSQRGEGEERKRSGYSCSTSVCSWNVNREETVILEVIKKE